MSAAVGSGLADRSGSLVAGRVVHSFSPRRAKHGRDNGGFRRDRRRQAAQRGGGRRRRARRRGPVPRRGGRVAGEHAPLGGQAGGQARAAALLLRGRPDRLRAAPAAHRPRALVRGGRAVADPEEAGRPGQDQPMWTAHGGQVDNSPRMTWHSHLTMRLLLVRRRVARTATNTGTLFVPTVWISHGA